MLITQLAVVFLAAVTSTRADDSLEEAYHAIRKRAMASTPVIYYSRPYMYGDGQPEDIGYGYQKNIGQPEIPSRDGVPVSYADLAREDFDERAANALEKLLLDYIEESKGPRPRYGDRVSNKRSVFRERDPEMIQRALEESEISQPSSFRERGKVRPSRVRSLARVSDSNPGPYSNRDAQEEEEYLNAVNEVLEKYRDEQDPEELTEEDLAEVLEYLGAKESKKRPYAENAGYDLYSPSAWKRGPASHHKRYNDMFDERYNYRSLQKRFPITKRSPAYYPYPLERRKKSDVKTDAKTAAELNNIFDSTPNSSATTPGADAKSTPTKAADATTVGPGQKEQALVGTQAGKPLELKKKSINWSDYFGLDRKKKSSDWLVDEYLRGYGLGPLEKRRPQQQSPEDVDVKMRAMEDMIVDEALKYTGAHEGSKDAKEIQDVKDRVMAQLAAAYSLEKMRRALGEFKASIAAQKATAPSSHSIPAPKSVAEHEKKIKEETPEKVSTSPVPKVEKKFSIDANQIPDSGSDNEDYSDCPVIDEITSRCQKITAHFMRGDKFLQICGFHQLCSACGAEELRFVSKDQCNEAYTEEMTDYCNGDRECLEAAEKSLNILNDDRRRWYGQPAISCDYWSNPCLSNIIPKIMSKR